MFGNFRILSFPFRRGNVKPFRVLAEAARPRSREMIAAAKKVIKRPMLLRKDSILFESVSALKGVGPITSNYLSKMGISRVVDLLLHIPRAVDDRSRRVTLKEVNVGEVATVEAIVDKLTPGNGGYPHILHAKELPDKPDPHLVTVYFFYHKATSFRQFLARMKGVTTPSAHIVLRGKIHSKKNGIVTIQNPEFALPATAQNLEIAYGIDPLYSLTEGLSTSTVTNAVTTAFSTAFDIDLKAYRKKLLSLPPSPAKMVTNKPTSSTASSTADVIDVMGGGNNPLLIPTDDWMCPSHRESHNWPSLVEAWTMLHAPDSPAILSHGHPARQRLAFDELVFRHLNTLRALQLKLPSEFSFPSLEESSASAEEQPLGPMSGYGSQSAIEGAGGVTLGDTEGDRVRGPLVERLIEILPFQLTACQRRAIVEIFSDLDRKSPDSNSPVSRSITEDVWGVGSGATSPRERMVRFLQGDVGSGKTIVTTMALLHVVEAGGQGAILAPTEILARQHFELLSKYFRDLDTALGTAPVVRAPKVALLTGSVSKAARAEILRDLSAGTLDVVVGTHSLIQEEVLSSFSNLGLTVIDEEQRFGVVQRENFSKSINTLYVSATPIPRSLMLTHMQSVDISTLRERPPRRRPVRTILLPVSAIDQLVSRLQANVNTPQGSKAFWVTQAVSSSKKGASAEERFAHLENLFPDSVGLLHGRLSADEKERVMGAFARGERRMLVATSIVEVGVDVPDASFCIIERAELFGLAQLHQIRGRIGRGDPPPGETVKECFCVLVYDDQDSEEKTLRAIEKLQILEKSNDGFKIAEADLALRGPGDVLGVRQKGLVPYKFFDFNAHSDFLEESQFTAFRILNGSYEASWLAEHPSESTSHDRQIFDKQVEFMTSVFFSDESTDKEVLSEPRESTNLSTKISTRPKKQSTDKIVATEIEVTCQDLSIPSRHDGIVAEDKKKTTKIWRAVDDVNIMDPTMVFVVIDLETTGLSVSSERIIQLAARTLQPLAGDTAATKFDAYTQLPPEMAISAEIQRITGIDPQFHKEVSIPFEDMWAGFTAWLRTCRGEDNRPIVLIAHNGRKFDFDFIYYELKRRGITEEWTVNANIVGFLDSLEVLKEKSCWVAIGAPPKLKLGIIHKHVTGKDIENAHNAVGDVDALANILNDIQIAWMSAANGKLFLRDASS